MDTFEKVAFTVLSICASAVLITAITAMDRCAKRNTDYCHEMLANPNVPDMAKLQLAQSSNCK